MTKNKDKKGKESTIGKIIYGFLLFMPLIAIGVTCLYAVSNKNAYQSYSNGNIEKAETINQGNQNDLYVNGQYIKYTFTEHNTQWNSSSFGFSNISLDLNNIFNTTNVTYISFNLYSSNNNINFKDNNGTNYLLQENNRPFDSFTYQVDKNNGNETTIYNYGLAQILTYQPLTIDYVFYDSIDKVEQSNLFNWAKNSIVYTTLVTTCNALSITNTFIPMLLAYWLIISVIYILYDIALMMIIIFHHKVHCLQDSI